MNVGGPAQQAYLLTRHLPEHGFDVLLASGEASPIEGNMLELRPEWATSIRSSIVMIPGLKREVRPWSDVQAFFSLISLIRRYRPDVVHTHMAKAGALGRVAAWICRVPVVVHTFHGTVFTGYFRPWTTRVAVVFERLFAAFSDRLITVTPKVATELHERTIGLGKTVTVPLGLELDDFGGVPPLEIPSPRVATLVARLTGVKDIPLFIESVGVARRSLPDLEAWVVGDGPLRDQLKESAPEWVTFFGNRADVADIVRRSGVVALTSRSEGSPVALIEALAAGRPVVAVPVGGVPDVLRDRPGATLTANRDAVSVAAAIVDALDGAAVSDAERGREAIVRDYSAVRLAEDISSLYMSLLEQRST